MCIKSQRIKTYESLKTDFQGFEFCKNPKIFSGLLIFHPWLHLMQ